MTNRENEALFEMLEQGDKSAREELILRNLPFVNYIFNKSFYAKNNADKEDFFQTGVIGLIKAVDSYKLGKCNFTTFAYTCIKNEIAMAMRKLPKAGEISLDLKQVLSNGEEFSLSEFIASDDDIEEEVIKKDTIAQLKSITKYKLSKSQSKVITLRYFSGEEIIRQDSIAEELNLSQGCVSRIEKKAILQLKKEIMGQQT